MKNFTLLTVLCTCLSFGVQAQTNSELSGNTPNGAKTGYVFDFNGTAAYNCPSQIPSDAYGIYSTYTINSIGNGSLSVTTSGTQDSWHRLNLRFTEGDCSPISLNLSSAASHKFEIKLNSSVTDTELMVQFSDGPAIGNFSDGNPPLIALATGDHTYSVNIPDFTGYNTNPDVDSLNVTHVSLFFRKTYLDPAAAGTFIIDQIRLGDVGIVTDSKPSIIESSLAYYPNPASDVLNVAYDYTGDSKIVLSNMTGTVVKTENVSAGTNAVAIDTKNIQSGIYLLSIVTEEGTVAKKVVVSGK